MAREGFSAAMAERPPCTAIPTSEKKLSAVRLSMSRRFISASTVRQPTTRPPPKLSIYRQTTTGSSCVCPRTVLQNRSPIASRLTPRERAREILTASILSLLLRTIVTSVLSTTLTPSAVKLSTNASRSRTEPYRAVQATSPLASQLLLGKSPKEMQCLCHRVASSNMPNSQSNGMTAL